jgi:hypothetical protein
MTSIIYGYINVMESKTGPPGILFLVRIFITENLTKTRTNLVKSLADLKYNQNIKTYWTTDVSSSPLKFAKHMLYNVN